MKLAFLGLGQMGRAMASHLIAGGHEVVLYNRTPEKAQGLGASVAPSPAAAAAGAEIVFTMLAHDAALRALAFGEEGFVPALAPGALHVSCSTISVACAEAFAAAHEKAGQRFLCAPVFGRPDAAAAAKLFFIVAGAEADIAACRPLFALMGQEVFVLGASPPQANLVKLSGNFLIAAVIESLGEVMALAEKGGVDKQACLTLLTSTLFSAPVFKTYGKLIVEQAFEPPGFAAPLGQKDIRLALEAGEALGVPLPFASVLRDRFLALIAQGGAGLDWSALGRLAARDAGL